MKGQIRRLGKNPELLKEYDTIIKAQEELGIIERVGKDSVINSHAKIHYMPHQAVVRKDAKTTKVRVVYDASAKVLKSSVSLNDCLHIGPSLNPLLFDILLRFREQRIALIADIEKAFLNIEVHERDRDSLRKTAKSFYVDDLASGESSTERAYQLYRKANERMNEGGFKLRKWRTNDSALRSQIEEDVRDVESSCVDEQTYAKTTLAQAQGQFGLLSPTIVKAKILFQDICYSGVDWDDTLPKSVKEKWEKWLRDLKELIASKTRVAPMKELSIPRLELMAARILAHLMSAVRKALESEYNFEGVKYCTDSMTVLYWIVNSGNWKQFVQHRVDEILRLSSKTEWSHCPGKENPADLGSRGVLMTELKNAEVWWSGPSWLRGSPRHYPRVKEIVPTVDSKVEEKRSFVVNLITSARSLFGIGNVISITSEMNDGECEWIKSAQLELREQPEFKQLERQYGLIEMNGILHCTGRLGESDLEAEAREPIVLPRRQYFTELVIRQCHESVMHGGVRSTLAQLRSKYWVPKGRQEVKRVSGGCVACKRWNTEVEANLNSRPLTYEYEEVNSEVLTPAHLVYGRRIVTLPDSKDSKINDLGQDSTRTNTRTRFKHLSAILEHFWSRWKREYLTNLREFHKGKKRGEWKTGVIQELICGKDKVVRGARVCVMTNGRRQVLNRAIQHLYPVEVKDESKVEGRRI
ncbi:uncharacterized protein LOC124455325 [Xenia sp. Carnegie-2017]|uniref:uncharacterized protein LOC124455325 n=1 Tax=Xenia sp. Carnegie-2017 TaxID=2897299 RepID=UPI001F041649|nr:uncharacterized protein LOC124455325 [Xenia sp. Carnegie-2017]